MVSFVKATEDIESVEVATSGVGGSCSAGKGCIVLCPTPATTYRNGMRIDSNGSYAWVGQGKGNYEQLEKYEFCGEGGGDWKREDMTTDVPPRLRRECIAILLALAVLVPVLCYLRLKPGGSPSPFSSTQASSEHDCTKDYGTWQVTWSHDKKDWCCLHGGKGCESEGQAEFDCNKGDEAMATLWSDIKQKWCCDHKQLCTIASAASGLPGPEGGGIAGVHAQLGGIAGVPAQPACDAVCVFKGAAASCRSRVDWSSKNEFQDHGEQACRLALGSVRSECSVCGSCSEVAVGCP